MYDQENLLTPGTTPGDTFSADPGNQRTHKKFFGATNFGSWYKGQRTDLLILAFTLGQRLDSLMGRVGHFKEETTAEGRQILVVDFPNMKNMQANQANSSNMPHRQKILPHVNAKIGAMAAFQR